MSMVPGKLRRHCRSPLFARRLSISIWQPLILGNMTLRLRVVSDQRRSLGDRSSIVFTVDGGTIGRSADNDWVFPDPLRYVSAHHARVAAGTVGSICRT